MRVVAVLLAAGTAAAVLGGCSDEPTGTEQNASVIVPGKPGEQASVIPPEDAGDHQQEPALNDADVTYVTRMIPHHQQAVVLTALVPERAADARVKAIAERISVAQDAEVTMMNVWLTDRGKAPVGAYGQRGGHPHAGDPALMPGMATQERIDALTAARGADFDRQFLDVMIAHHEGALAMAGEVLADGVDVRAQEMAQDVVTGQTAEIGRMQDIRDA
ncbi:DUF305 domain-containing protein [Amycolatopsis antarctica]|nr:DUF305 domain-containing protein [Amycolatopsis antarctica]